MWRRRRGCARMHAAAGVSSRSGRRCKILWRLCPPPGHRRQGRPCVDAGCQLRLKDPAPRLRWALPELCRKFLAAGAFGDCAAAQCLEALLAEASCRCRRRAARRAPPPVQPSAFRNRALPSKSPAGRSSARRARSCECAAAGAQGGGAGHSDQGGKPARTQSSKLPCSVCRGAARAPAIPLRSRLRASRRPAAGGLSAFASDPRAALTSSAPQSSLATLRCPDRATELGGEGKPRRRL